jgi:hypothetical protein
MLQQLTSYGVMGFKLNVEKVNGQEVKVEGSKGPLGRAQSTLGSCFHQAGQLIAYHKGSFVRFKKAPVLQVPRD